MVQLSVVLPTYNERKNVSLLIPELEAFFRKHNFSAEIVIVDDMSPDGTGDVARELNKKYGNIRVVNKEKKEGVGAALRVGYTEARGEYILSSDSDLSFKVSDMLKLIQKLEEGYDLVVGSRHMNKGGYDKPTFRIKLKGLISQGGNVMIRLLTGVHLHDFSANFRIIKRGVWHSIQTKENTNSILLEMILKTVRAGYKVTEVPVVFEDRMYGESKLNMGIEVPKFLIKLVGFFFTFRVLRR